MPDQARTPAQGPAPGDDDTALLARLRNGDRAAFALLVRRHSGSLLRVAMSLVRDRAVAEEVVQDTWLGVLTGLASFEGRSSLRTWIFQILVNRARTRFVREMRSVPFSALAASEAPGEAAVDPARFDPSGAWRVPPARWTEEDPERLLMRAETRDLIEAAIQGLPVTQRTVITLRDVEGLEAEEICNVLGITVTNQRVLLHRARAKVRRALESRAMGPAGQRSLGGEP